MTALGLLLGGFFVLLAIGAPISVAMGMGAVLAVVLGTDLPLVVVGQRMLVILDSFPFLALPFFVIAGLFMEKGGITQRLIDFAALMARFDTFLIGRKTFDAMRRMGDAAPPTPGIRSIVFSRTLRPEDCPQATLSDDAERVVADLRRQPGKDIALFGGGELFRSLLAAGLVDEDVSGFDVAMNQAPPMRRVECLGDLADDGESAVEVEDALAVDQSS